jgi:hypothetical protein
VSPVQSFVNQHGARKITRRLRVHAPFISMSSNIPASTPAGDSLDSERHGTQAVHTAPGAANPAAGAARWILPPHSRASSRSQGAPSKYAGLSRPTSAAAVSCVSLPHLPLARVAAYVPLGA